jgi:ribosomal protein S18 acetylase RimI-like enzyme
LIKMNISESIGVRFRLMTTEDIPQAMQLKDAARWNQTSADWLRFLSGNPEGCFVASVEGRIVGTSASIVYEGKLAWIGMVIVDPQYRGQGIGTTLLQYVIRYLDSRRIQCMKLDATPHGKPVYQKFGFVSEYEIERWMLKRRPNAIIPVCPSVEFEDAVQFDREIFGADRSQILRSLTDAAPEFTRVVRQKARVDGYIFGRRGSHADHLGPWVARNRNVAEMLLVEFLLQSNRELVFVDCLTQNPWTLPLLRAHHFQFSRPLTRMFRGTNVSAGKPELLFAVLGPEFG